MSGEVIGIVCAEDTDGAAAAAVEGMEIMAVVVKTVGFNRGLDIREEEKRGRRL